MKIIRQPCQETITKEWIPSQMSIQDDSFLKPLLHLNSFFLDKSNLQCLNIPEAVEGSVEQSRYVVVVQRPVYDPWKENMKGEKSIHRRCLEIL